MVKGLVDQDIQRELLSQLEEMDLENTIAFVEVREGDRFTGDRLSNIGDTIQEEEPLHEPERGKAATNTQTNNGDSFDRLYSTAVGEVGEPSNHRDPGGEDNKSDRLYDYAADYAAMFSVSVMHNRERSSNSNLCYYRVSVKEFGYKMEIRKQLETRINVMLQNEQYDKLSNKFIRRKLDAARK